jgi:hypothetical protein
MTVEDARFSDADEAWYARLRVQARRRFILGILGYVIVVGVIAVTLWVLWGSVDAARSELNQVRGELAKTRNDLSATQSRYQSLQKEYDALTLKKNAAEQAVSESQAQVEQLKKQVEQLKKQLDQIYDFRPHVVRVDEIDEKLVYGLVGERGFRILSRAIEDSHRKLPFSGVNTPTAGFTSPGYATYLLREVGVYTPIDQMPQQRGAPQNGDIIIYGAGYTMFYFDLKRKRFVIGMTPQGVLALDPNFSPPIKAVVAYQPR